uniref:Uncharacterized protein n=1 Tax=Brassica campestris TaxID=3711 RepID=A0A3P6CT32_BRACM|nr:unnamed protein product [Brassica rapa]
MTFSRTTASSSTSSTAGFDLTTVLTLALSVRWPVIFKLLLTISKMIIKSICMMVAPSTTVMSSQIHSRLRMLRGCLRCSTVLEDSSAYTLRRFSLGRHQCTWPFCVSWETRRRLRSLVTVWKLELTAVN